MNSNGNRNSLYGFEMREEDRRRVPREDRKTYDVKQLWQRNHEILNLALLGMKGTEIAKVLNVHEQTVSNTLNSELGEKKLSELRKRRDEEFKDVATEVAKLFPIAMKTYKEILEGQEKSKLQKEVADTVLMDIGGHRAPTKVQSENAHLYLTPEDIEEFKKRGIAAAKASGMLVDVESESEAL